MHLQNLHQMLQVTSDSDFTWSDLFVVRKQQKLTVSKRSKMEVLATFEPELAQCAFD